MATPTPGTIPALPPYQPGGLALAGTEQLEIASSSNATSALSARLALTDVGKIASVLPLGSPTANDLVAIYQHGTGVPIGVTAGDLSTIPSFGSKAPNIVLAGPSSGVATAAPTFRSLVAADFTAQSPNLFLAGPATGTATAAPTFRALGVKDIPIAASGYINVKAYGALGDGATNDTVAVQAAITFLESASGAGGILYFPAGVYILTGGITVSTSIYSIRLVGAGIGATIFRSAASGGGVDVTVVTVGGTNNSMEDISVFGNGTNNDTGTFAGSGTQHCVVWSCGSGYARNCRIWGGSGSAMHITGNDNLFENLDCSVSYGLGIITTTGSNWFVRCKFDLDAVGVAPTDSLPYSARANLTIYTVGQVRSSGGYLLECTIAGTSGAGSPTLKNYGVAITDGSVTWMLLAPVGYSGFYVLTGGIENRLIQTDLTGSGFTYSLKVDAAGAWIEFCDGVLASPVDFVTGSYALLRGNALGAAITVEAPFKAVITDNIAVGATNVVIAANANNITVANNDFAGGTITVTAGTGDRVVVEGNKNATVVNNATGTNNVNRWMPQPQFSAYNSSTDANATGDGTVVTVDFDTEVFDPAGNFSADAFTAPATGKYSFSGTVTLGDITSAFTVALNLVTSNRTYTLFYGTGISQSSNIAAYPWAVACADLDVGDTAIVQLTVSGSTKTVDVVGNATVLQTYFCGRLLT